MKYFYFAFCFLISTASLAQNPPSASQYLGEIGGQFSEISKDMMSYTSAAAHSKSARKVDTKRKELIQQVKTAERNVRKLKPFNGDTKLRDSVVQYFMITHIVLTEDYAKIMDLEDIAEQSFNSMEAYLLAKEKAGEKEDEAFDMVKIEYDRFAAENNINLISSESKLSDKMEKSGKVNKYFNQIYLLFFKSYKNEYYLTEAINKGDINAMEQSKNALLESASEDLLKLGPIESFRGDATLKVACQKLLQFYKIEASQKIPQIIDFYLKKENYEKMKASFDSKKQSQRTQQDIDSFNKAIDEFNKAVNTVNAVNNDINKSRSELFEKWQKAGDAFRHKHTPKYR